MRLLCTVKKKLKHWVFASTYKHLIEFSTNLSHWTYLVLQLSSFQYSGTGAVKRKRGGPGGLNKICGVSPELQKVVGETAMSRTQVCFLSIYSFTLNFSLQYRQYSEKLVSDRRKANFDKVNLENFIITNPVYK